MPTFPTSPSIVSRLATGSALTYAQMDDNFGNLSQSIDETITILPVAAWTDSNNVFEQGTSQSIDYVHVSHSISAKATLYSLTASNALFIAPVTFSAGLNFPGGALTSDVVGTASWAESASWLATSSWAESASVADTSSWSVNSWYSNTASYAYNAVGGATGTFTSADSKTITVTNGIITSIV